LPFNNGTSTNSRVEKTVIIRILNIKLEAACRLSLLRGIENSYRREHITARVVKIEVKTWRMPKSLTSNSLVNIGAVNKVITWAPIRLKISFRMFLPTDTFLSYSDNKAWDEKELTGFISPWKAWPTISKLAYDLVDCLSL
jgi:hypothetical protein